MAKRPDLSVPGILIVDKPYGLTSHDVVARVRKMARTRKVGHAGTLDPMATGVLIVGVGKATRLLHWITGHDKAYSATIRFGVATLSDDAQGEVLQAVGCAQLSAEQLEAAMAPLRGDVDQVPSKVSAKKIAGQRAYDLVRSGAEVDLAPNRVRISRCEAVSDLRHLRVDVDGVGVDVVDVDIDVECSSGTYIRAIARDLGQALGCGAHLTALRRTRVGNFTAGDALNLAECEDACAAQYAALPAGDDVVSAALPLPVPGLIPLSEAVRRLFPAIILTPAQQQRFSHGQAPAYSTAELREAFGARDESILGAFDESGEVLGLLDAAGETLSTVTVFKGATQ